MCCVSPNSSVVKRAVEVHYARQQRASSLRWSAVSGVVLLVLAYDLSCKCPGYTSMLHYVELVMASVMCANLIQHARHLLPAREGSITITSDQKRLLGLSDADLDSSFKLADDSMKAPTDADITNHFESSNEFSISLSPRRAWRSTDSGPPSSPAAPRTPGSGSPLHYHDHSTKDEFIADRSSLSDYLKQYEERSRLESPNANDSLNMTHRSSPTWVPTCAVVPPNPPPYQLATMDSESSTLEERSQGVGGAASGVLHPVWWRVQLDPQRLTQFNLNLRLWIHITILERLVRAMEAADTALARLGLPPSDARLGDLSLERLRKLAASGGASTALAPLLPFLEPFPDQRYLVMRIKELSRGGCLSEYKWDGGGGDWSEARPSDSELVLHLLAAYLDTQLPAGAGAAGGARPFSAAHVSAAPQPPPQPLAIHRVSRKPPHFVLVLPDETLEVARGRNNLLHTILLFLAVVARQPPPALRRLHLGPAGLNMLWIIGR